MVSDQIGFFYFQKLVFGGLKINLYNLENEIIRKRFPDPRIHFAINCASGGCPRLPRTAFHVEDLEVELEREAAFFINEPRNYWIDSQTQTIHVSSILDWYREDFLGWMQRSQAHMGDSELLDYVRLYLHGEQRVELDQAKAAGYTVVPIPYDWSLNDQNGH